MLTPAEWDDSQTTFLRVYTDGSCWARLSLGDPRAGYSVVAIDEARDITAVELGRVPPRLPQSAAAAEAWAFHRAASLMGNVFGSFYR